MSSKKKPIPPRPSNVISLDALLGNWPTIELAGITFEGRELNQREKAAVGNALRDGDDTQQAAVLVAALQARGAKIEIDWFYNQPDAYLIAIVDGLMGRGWVGETPKQ